MIACDRALSLPSLLPFLSSRCLTVSASLSPHSLTQSPSLYCADRPTGARARLTARATPFFTRCTAGRWPTTPLT